MRHESRSVRQNSPQSTLAWVLVAAAFVVGALIGAASVYVPMRSDLDRMTKYAKEDEQLIQIDQEIIRLYKEREHAPE